MMTAEVMTAYLSELRNSDLVQFYSHSRWAPPSSHQPQAMTLWGHGILYENIRDIEQTFIKDNGPNYRGVLVSLILLIL